MRFSVVINTYNRAESLRTTLDALKQQVFRAFEVVVVNGPSADGTQALLDERAHELRTAPCPDVHLGRSRNIGIDAAAGDVVAFIDDDAIPEPRWLADLAAAYEDPGVGGAGGLVLDHTGVHAQYRWSVCHRLAVTDFDKVPPLDAYNRPGADPYVYLQGTNCSFRRDALEAIDGFDEEIEYGYDESEVCLQLIDRDWRMAALPGAVVHHKFLPSHMRRKVGVTDPFFPVKNRAYFALRNAPDDRTVVFASLAKYMYDIELWANQTADLGDLTDGERDHFVERARAGLELGIERGLAGVRKGRPIAPRPADEFRPYPTIVPEGRRLTVCFISLDYPPKPAGGIARFTADLARGFGEAGHEAHVVTRDDEHAFRTDWEDGVWVHRFPMRGRYTPELGDHPVRSNIEHLAHVRNAVEAVAERTEIDVVSGPLWVAEPTLCAYDPRFVTAMACMTPMRVIAETQPATAASPLTPFQVALEQAALRSPAHLQPVSHANAVTIRDEIGDKDVNVIWHGVVDRVEEFPRTRDPQDEAVEVLFVGRLEPRKGVDTLLDAAIPLLSDRPWLRIRLVGADNPHGTGEEGFYQRMVADRAPEVAGQIEFSGEVSDEDLYRAYADCDVFCGPSRYESFGLVHVEAMMFGRPVLACRAGGMQETVADGETGLLVEPGDADALRDALERVVDSREERDSMGAAARARYETEFRNEVAVARNADFYDRLSRDRPPVPDDWEAVLHGRVRDLVAEACDLDPEAAAGAAHRLLERDRFPVDYERGVREILGLSDRAFVDGLYRLFFDRAPDPPGLAGGMMALGRGTPRLQLVRDVATSAEARSLDVDPSFIDRLPDLDLDRAAAVVRSAWLLDDAGFAAMLERQLAGDVDASPAAPADRRAHLDELLDRPEVAARVGDPAPLRELELRSAADLGAELERLARSGPDDFVGGAYRLLLGREADPGGAAGHAAVIRGGAPPADVVRALVQSEEGGRRWVDPQAILDALPSSLHRGKQPLKSRLRGALARTRPEPAKPADDLEAGPDVGALAGDIAHAGQVELSPDDARLEAALDDQLSRMGEMTAQAGAELHLPDDFRALLRDLNTGAVNFETFKALASERLAATR